MDKREAAAKTDVQQTSPARSARRWWMLAAGAVAIGILVFLIVCLAADHRVVLVNGLPRPYSVQLDGRTYDLSPYGHLQISLGSGSYTVSGQGDAITIPEQQIRISHPFLPSSQRCVVINPDRVALLTWQARKYVEKYINRDSAGQDFRRLFGQAVYDLPQVDYLFEPLPGRVPGNSSAWKWSLTHDQCRSDQEWCEKVRFEYGQDPRSATSLRQASDPQFKWVSPF